MKIEIQNVRNEKFSYVPLKLSSLCSHTISKPLWPVSIASKWWWCYV